MSDPITLFGMDPISGAIGRLVARIKGLDAADEFAMQRNSHLIRILNSMRNNASDWNRDCQVNIRWIGNHFEGSLTTAADSPDLKGLNDVFILAYRFLYELYLSAKGDLSQEFRAILSFVDKNADKFGEANQDQLDFVRRDLPAALFKELANSEAIEVIRDYVQMSRRVKAQSEAMMKEVNDKEQKVDALKAALDKYETAFNFVGLYQGFDDMAAEKKSELRSLRKWLVFFGAVSLIPLVSELIFIYIKFNEIDATHTLLLYAAVPTLSIMILLIYFFRIFLHNYKSIKSQLLQLDLRRSLCRFIQDYAEYSSRIKQKDKDALSRFEAIVFSSILSDEDKLPSTYDGLEQMGKIIKSIK